MNCPRVIDQLRDNQAENRRPLMNINIVNAESAPKAAGGYAQAVAVSGAARLLFISGQIPETLAGDVPADFPSQAHLAWHNLFAQLSAAGMSGANLVKVTIFLSSREFATVNREIRREILGAHTPALTVIITGIFDEKWLLEIEAIAAG
jgi:2-iminobutanoate/2-iminopropanoate deaminase